MPKTTAGDVETCLKNLIQALRTAKKEARKKAEEERLNAEADIEKDEPEDGKNGVEKGPTHREEASEEEEGT